MQCQRCGATNPEGAGFCATCGTALVTGTAAAPAPTPPAPTPPPAFGDADRTVPGGPVPGGPDPGDTALADILGGSAAETTAFPVPGAGETTAFPVPGGGAAPPAFGQAPTGMPAPEAPAWGPPPAAAEPAFGPPPAFPPPPAAPEQPPAAPAWQVPPAPPTAPAWGQQAPPAPGYPQAGWDQAPPQQPTWQGGGGGFTPPGVGAFAGAGGYGAPTGAPAPWGPRALGYLIDYAVLLVPYLVLSILAAVIRPFAILAFLWILASIAGGVWFAIQVGSSGASPGMRVMGLRCISTRTGQPIGGGMGVVRTLLHSVCSLACGVGLVVDLLFPLWDRQRQTLADKMVSTVVVEVPKQPFSIAPPGQLTSGPPWLTGQRR